MRTSRASRGWEGKLTRLAQFRRRDLSQNVEKNGVKMGNHESTKSRTLSFTNFRDYHSVKTSARSPTWGILSEWLRLRANFPRAEAAGSLYGLRQAEGRERRRPTVYTLRTDDHIQRHCDNTGSTSSSYFTPFCLNARLQITPLLTFRSLVFGLTPFCLVYLHLSRPSLFLLMGYITRPLFHVTRLGLRIGTRGRGLWMR